nr:hypothetical protein [uncultured Emticicia sp.]
MKELLRMKLERELENLITLINQKLGSNPYIDLDNSLKIVLQKNYKQFPLIKKKINYVFMRLYDSQLYVGDIKLTKDLINNTLSEIIKFDKIP